MINHQAIETNNEEILLEQFVFDKEGNKLGNGAYGTVFWATRKGKKHAIKDI
jgi:hypothetical protein